MKSAFQFVSLLLTIILPSWVALAQEESPPNLVFNGGFERVDDLGLPEGWGNWLKTLPEPNCITVDDSVAHSGKRSLKISHKKPTSYSMMTRRVEFEPHKQYIITGWIKGANIKPGDGAMLARLYIGKEGGSTFKCSKTFSGSFDWRFIEIGPFDVGDRTWVSMIPYLHNSTGTVWYDDITMRLVTQADLDRRAQQRARDRLLKDLDRVHLVAREIDDAKVLAQEQALRERVRKADDLPTSFETCNGPPYFPLHTEVYAYTTWGLLKGRTEMSRADLRAHRINTYVIQGSFTPWPIFDDKGQWQGLDWSKMDQQISLHQGAKCFLLWPGLEAGRTTRLTPDGGPDYPNDPWKVFAARWAKELAAGMTERGFGYDQWALYLVDEPSGRRAEIARTAGEAVHSADPKIRIFENPYGAATDRDMRHMAPVIDIWCPSLNTAKDQRLEFCRETAREVWTYQVLSKTSDPLRVYRAAFWECFAKDLRGHGFWDYADCGGSPWDAYDHDRHDYAVVYDGAEDELIPSKRWEAYREGAEDFALLSMLRDQGAHQKAQTLAEAVVASPQAATVRAARQEAIRALAAQQD